VTSVPDGGMRLAGHTYAFRKLPLEAALSRLSELGFTDVELWLGHTPDGPAEAATLLERSGLRACAVSAGGYYRSGDDTARRAGQVAQAVGAPTVVSCAAPHLVAELAHLVPAGVQVAVENHWDQPLDTSAQVLDALGEAPSARACLDTGHALIAGEQPDRAVDRLGARLVHVHLKEARLPTLTQRLLGRKLRKRLQGRPPPVFPGDGALDLAALKAHLEQIGYAGWVSLEHEGTDPAHALSVLRQGWSSY
jgi:sugar phosphate isomerase/epimerase